MLAEETALIERARQADPDAWGTLYERHAQAIYSYLYYRLRDRELAEDLTADVFTRALTAIERYSDRGLPFGAWLHRIAHNLMIDATRRRARQPEPLDEDWPLAADEAESPQAWLEMQLTHDALGAALTELTEAQQQVIILRFVQEKSLAEVAQVLGKTQGAIESLQHRALAALLRVLQRSQALDGQGD